MNDKIAEKKLTSNARIIWLQTTCGTSVFYMLPKIHKGLKDPPPNDQKFLGMDAQQKIIS